MKIIKKLFQKKDDGTFDEQAIPLGTDAIYVDMENGNNLENEIQSIHETLQTIVRVENSTLVIKIETKDNNQ